jgi:uncharacterized membrane protein YkoI
MYRAITRSTQQGRTSDMNFVSRSRSQILAVTAVAAAAAGAAAIIMVALASSHGTQPQPGLGLDRQLPASVTSDVSSPTMPAVPSQLPKAAPSLPPQAAAAASARAPLSPLQARALAERAANGQADQVEATVGPNGGVSYAVSVVRADGTDVQLVIDGRTGRVLSNVPEAQDTQPPQDIQSPPDTPSSGD